MKNLNKRKELAARVLNVGVNRIVFDTEKLTEIKEAITKQDIRDFYKDGIIMIKDKKGTKKKERRKTKRGPGKIKKKVRDNKKRYVILVRKFRKYTKELKKQGKINEKEYWALRKKIKAGTFKDKEHIKSYIGGEK